jgi:S-adenosylmethionine:tRNA ribosyltransferase-isomerase
MLTSDFHYDLPDTAIAQEAVEPRDAARLLDTRTMEDRRFSDLPGLLRPGDLLVVNRSRVTAARLVGRKSESGGRVELLLLRPIGDGSWEALVRPARRPRAGTRVDVGEAVVVLGGDPVNGLAVVTPESGSLEETVTRMGEMPLPPYFRGRLPDDERYQTVYADRPGSAAAPTAGLHFTGRLLEGVRAAGVEIAAVDLRIGLDTFRPIGAETVGDHVIHSEIMELATEVVDAVARARERGGRIVAVGTTVVRALESAAAPDGGLEPYSGPTSLFIVPGHRFRVVDMLVTNFHVPSSTLIVLVAAFMGEVWRTAYEEALRRGYRFLSFGDSMLAEREPS